MIVADTNLIAYLVLPGERTVAAEAVLLRDPEWAAPTLWKSELRNILATYVRADRVALDDALAMSKRAADLMAGREFSVPTEAVLVLAAESGCAAYDCEWIALARALAVPLVTADVRVREAFPDVAVAPEEFGCAPPGA